MYFILWEVLSGIILYGFSIFMSCLWNILLVLLVVCELSHLVLMLIYETNYVTSVNPALPHYVAHQDLVAMYNTINNLNSFVLILAFLSTFRLVQDNESFSKVWQTLHLSMGTLGAFFFVYFVVMSAFLFAGHFSFGAEIEGWSTLIGSFNQLLAMLSHSPSKSLAEMMETDPVVGPLFFALYMFVLLFLMTSVFVAILNDAYSEANKFIVDNESTYWKDVFLAPFRVFRQVISGGDAAIARKAIKAGKKKKKRKKKTKKTL
eukprot:g2555.t1